MYLNGEWAMNHNKPDPSVYVCVTPPNIAWLLMLGLSRTIARQRRDGRLVEVVFSRLASRFDEYDQSTKSPVCLLIDFRVENPRISFICLMNEQSPRAHIQTINIYATYDRRDTPLNAHTIWHNNHRGFLSHGRHTYARAHTHAPTHTRSGLLQPVNKMLMRSELPTRPR